MKKSLTFAGPIHHLNTLSPIVKELEKQGVENTFFSANAEACFEYGLSQHLGAAWEFLPLYNDTKRQERLYNETVQYFRELYRKPSAVSFLVPPITDRILREICCDTWATRSLMKKIQPTVCLALHEINRWGMLFGYWCAEQRIPYFTIQEGMYYSKPEIYRGHTKYSTSLVWGEATKRKLLAAGCPEEKLIVTGHPGLKARWDDAVARREEALKILPEHFWGKKYALLYVTNINLQHIDVPTLVAGLSESDYKLIVRVAVMSTIPLIEKVQGLFMGYQEVVFVSPPSDDFALPLAALCDVICVLGCSTLTLESLWKGKPVAEVFSPGVPFSFRDAGVAADATEVGAALRWIEGAQELFSRTEHQEKVQAFVADEIADAQAAPKMAEIILS